MTVVMVMYVFDATNQNPKRGYQNGRKPSNPEIFSPCLFFHSTSTRSLPFFNSPEINVLRANTSAFGPRRLRSLRYGMARTSSSSEFFTSFFTTVITTWPRRMYSNLHIYGRLPNWL